MNDYLNTYTYDTNGNLLTSLNQSWENGEWMNGWLNTCTYNTNEKRLTYLNQTWQNGEWMNRWLYTYTWDTNGNMLTALNQDRENDTWMNDWLKTFTYYANGNRLTDLLQTWENGVWVNDWLKSYTYDTNENRLTSLYQNWENSAWVNYELSTYTYDANGNRLTLLSQDWENGGWMNSYLYTYTYDGNENRLTELFQLWENGEWVNNEKEECIFLPGHVNATAYDWDGGNWLESSLDASLNIYMGGEYVFGYFAINLELYYTDVTGIEEQDVYLGNSPVRCYPNPAKGQINLEINPGWQSVNCHLELYSQTGQKVKSFEISSDFGLSALPLSVEDVPPGLYLLRVIAGKQLFSQKIIISK